MKTNQRDELYKVALLAREMTLQPLKGNSEGSCLYASYLLNFFLNRMGGYSSRIRGGGNGDGGIVVPHGSLKGHYWVEVKDIISEKIFIVDITSDQFGYDEIIILSLAENNRYFPGDQSEIDLHVNDIHEELYGQYEEQAQ